MYVMILSYDNINKYIFVEIKTNFPFYLELKMKNLIDFLNRNKIYRVYNIDITIFAYLKTMKKMKKQKLK